MQTLAHTQSLIVKISNAINYKSAKITYQTFYLCYYKEIFSFLYYLKKQQQNYKTVEKCLQNEKATMHSTVFK